MNADDHPFVRIALLILAWFATITLADVQIVVAILSGLAVLVYTAFKTYYLVKNKGQG